ncbi:DNA polymerase-3 subunit alpha (Gram-positive type) [Clostridium tetanomorphum]|uniref:DNA polymerase III PolC-type n=1 Tax=Clostridium tetanomorphum TaxID=1553 RepID=A0A923J018_CLOTT|nr:DNA polymerase III subunit alpha [Clostridium tetanomorphum]KAJ53743.1 DNA polymerase III subunit alpha [Clostridium tetanomorphum DSM 665]MBC2397254.1 DNA polymerase III subunit alpha [Clostridium tetanomorphum]MBP1862471.1 DNA polymerase-3 subunit alpha (Gram-positive type) [Clostridium tetanomorphum]NRS85689.1 DNA polymerase-3 subunit alpha (Gram-positive type) [Clostridium tetanomorphum]NRZ96301.1 DNA polymerase-3 subunit alpha (Gram-positive type) [Clostridium tetanomorphum]
MKRINEIFSDYEVGGSINTAIVESVVLSKKTKTVKMKISSDKYIEIRELERFNKFIRQRFALNDSKIAVKYADGIDKKPIEEELKNIIFLMSDKYPALKAVLNSSEFEVVNNTINFNFKVPVSGFLKSMDYDKKIYNIIKNLYGTNYKIDFIDKVSSEELIRMQEDKRASEMLIITKEVKNALSNNTPKLSKEVVEKKQEIKVENDGKKGNSLLILGRSIKIRETIIKITDITPDEGRVAIEGEIFNIEEKELRSGKTLISFDLYDGSSSMTCKAFCKPGEESDVLSRLKKAKGIRIAGNAGYSKFTDEIEIIANTIVETEGLKKIKRQDNAKVKRVELHMHTQMSQMDAMTGATDLIKRAMSWGMKSIAITDHGVVQAFPEAHKLLGRDNPDMKVIYGVEAYLAPDKKPSVTNPKGQSIDTIYCVLDLETTGFSPVTEKITEIGIMKLKDGKVIDQFSCFVNPEKPIPSRVIEVTNITDDMVRDAETIEQVFPKMLDFIKDSVLVAHNATFDVGFLKHNARMLGYDFDFTYVDTLSLAQGLFPDFKTYKLGRIAKNLGIKVEVAHRALDDVDTTVKVFNVMLEKLKKRGAETLQDIDTYSIDEEAKKQQYKKLKTYHAIIFAKDYVGLKNLYRLVSYSHLDYFYKKPRILKSLYKKYSEGLILGSACSEGELYQAILLGKSDEEIEAIAKEYDYLEIQPLGNNDYLVRTEQVPNREYLKEINRKIVALGEKLNKLVVATGDVHFMDPEDEIYRRILEAGQGFKDADNQAPLYLRTTEEMLEEFSYLGQEKAYEVVVTNTNKIADMCEPISPISPEKATPHIDGCEQTIKDIAYGRAHELYGDPLPEIVQSRLDRELDSIIKNGFSVMYIIAQKLVWKSNEDGYLVGSRGSVGSSVVAYMTGITEVNALPPHYRCPSCKYSDFTDYGIKNGFDLSDKTCPVCGESLAKDGIDIPFETFLGFNGDKEPDIDLNFSGEYQAKAHKYTEVIFGKGTTFKAGTIGTIAEKTAFGYVKKYFDEKNRTVNKAEITRISKGCTGIKRTTGQHPGGIIVVPKGREIFEFCPVQHPADDPNSDIITTHFDYHSIDQNLLKLDILGHDDPTVIRMLQDITGVDPQTIPMDDKETMSIFSSTEALGVTPEQINSKVGTFGIPEFGTKFVRGMLLDTMPKTFFDLICISGLSHGTDVWVGNAKDLVDSGVVTLGEAVCTRDDIMIYLIKKGLPPNTAFKIMELVRKGKALKDPEKWAEYEALMRKHEVPEWYIDSCKKIKYMFPKAHAAAYVMMAFRIAWFKVHIPKAYYAAYFTIRAKAFDSEFMIFGKEKVKEKMKEIEMIGNQAAPKDKDMYDDLEIVLEMYERGIKFLSINLYKSHATKFLVEEDGLRPPLNSIAGMGNVAAEGIFNAAHEEKPLSSIEDLKKRAKIGNVAIDLLKKFGCLKGLPESDQVCFFDIM